MALVSLHEPVTNVIDEQKLDNDAATMAAGGELARALRANGGDQAIIHLVGDLGAGKTTFARGFLAGLGHVGRVPSPTYTLIEPYDLPGFSVYHIDLYRLSDPEEVIDLGLEELVGAGAVLLIEWPEHGGRRVGPPDVRLTLSLDGEGRILHRESLTTPGDLMLLR